MTFYVGSGLQEWAEVHAATEAEARRLASQALNLRSTRGMYFRTSPKPGAWRVASWRVLSRSADAATAAGSTL